MRIRVSALGDSSWTHLTEVDLALHSALNALHVIVNERQCDHTGEHRDSGEGD